MTVTKVIIRIFLIYIILALPFTATAATKLRVAYIPIMPMSQLFIMEGEGWTREAGIELELMPFSSGPAMMDAIASGKVDVMYIGIGPAMLARANGMPVRVVASGTIESVSLMAHDELAGMMASATSPAEGVRAFTAKHGRKPRIASLPKGSVPDIVLRHWLTRVVGLQESDIDIVGMGAGALQKAMLNGSVDGAMVFEPIRTEIRRRVAGTQIVANARQMLPKQPGAVLAVNEKTIAKNRNAIVKLVALHARATAFIRSEPKRAALTVHGFLGNRKVRHDTIESALLSSLRNYVADPRLIVASTKVMHDFSARIGTLAKPVPLNELFDLSLYAEATK